MSAIANVNATKHGITYDDHHFKKDGRYERSPPSKFKAMYDYLPTEMVGNSHKQTPTKLTLQGDNPTSQRETLKSQVQCLGVYARVPSREANGHPMWKHTEENLCIGHATIDGEPGWVVAQFTTWHDENQQRCMKLTGSEQPWSTKAGMWSAWTGRVWSETAGVRVRPTYHGWGREGVGQWSNTESSCSPPRSQSSPKRSRSPGGV